MTSKQVFMAAIALMFLAVGCNNKGADNSASIGQRNLGRGGALQTVANQSAFYTNSVGRVYSDAAYADAFSGAIRRLVTASIDEQYVGTVGATDAVKLTGYIEVDSYGNVVAGKSAMSLEIRDSYAGQVQDGKTVPALVITMPVTSGRALNGSSTLTFSDNYGSITLNGTFTNGSSGQFSGTMSFSNTNGGSGQGLSFQIATCGFFRCY